MNPSANVLATATLVDFRAALCTFSDNARDAVGMLQADIRRAQDFLAERQSHWKAAVRHAEDLVFQTKNELVRRRMMRIGDRSPDCSEQEEAFHRARQQLEHAQEKLDACRRWQRELAEALVDYEGPANQFSGALDGDVPRMRAFLDSKIASLEAYTQVS